MRKPRLGSFSVRGLFFKLWPEFEDPYIDELDNKKIQFYMHNKKSAAQSTHRRSPASSKEEYSRMGSSNMFEIARDMNISLPTIIFIHGFMETDKPNVITELISGLKETGRRNIILVDWHTLAAGPWYPWAVVNVPAVGRLLANFLDTMARIINKENYFLANDNDLSSPSDTFFRNLHLVGFSLGAHVAGIAGHLIKMGRVGRITGIEPALPMIDLLDPDTERLDPADAEFVDVIHTCAGRYGTPGPVGHVDFYPNGGKAIQPGCRHVLAKYVCSHWRAWGFFAESMLNEKSFEAVRCGSWKEFEAGLCANRSKTQEEPVYMGVGARQT
ncbi:lipase member H-like [Hetaerina americana]|uniref:lipase member H-like n=1 Tax=Hetaerina americana TaxID=62018 RepID=UPI003A7F59E7